MDLLEHGANPNTVSNLPNGNTALHLACLSEMVPVIKLLLEKGADIHAKNAMGESVAEGMLLPKQSKLLIQKALQKEKKALKKKGSKLKSPSSSSSVDSCANCRHSVEFAELKKCSECQKVLVTLFVWFVVVFFFFFDFASDLLQGLFEPNYATGIDVPKVRELRASCTNWFRAD